jgi:methionyl-tRNA formyltransferase
MTDPATIVVLTGPELARAALAPFYAQGYGAKITSASDLNGLRRIVAFARGPLRLIAVASGVLVPDGVLRSFQAGAYNVHPGPPNYRGLYPSVFALYDRAADFGVTVHEMTAEPDSGPIVACTRFPIPSGTDRLGLDTLTLKHIVDALERLAPQLVDIASRLPPTLDAWSGPVRRKSDFDALCRLPANIGAEEFARRYRAIGEGPHHALEIEIQGHRFELDNRRALTVVRAGQSAARSAA